MKILTFGICRDITGVSELDWPEAKNVGKLKEELFNQYPELRKLASLAIAVDNEYVQDDRELKGGEEIALIPPVSGG